MEENKGTTITSEINAEETPFGTGTNPSLQKKKGNILLAIIVSTVVAIILMLVYYFGYYTKTEELYKNILNSGIDTYMNANEENSYNTSKATIEIDADIDFEEEYSNTKIIDLVNDTDIKVEAQIDNQEKQIALNLDTEYDKEELLNLKLYYDINDKESYVYIEKLLNKYIEIELDEKYYLDILENWNTEEKSIGKKINLLRVNKILKKEIANIIKSEYCSNIKEQVSANGKTVNATKNTMEMTLIQFQKEIEQVFINLKNNNKFLQCFGENKSKVIEIIENAIKELEEIEKEIKEEEIENIKIQVNLYTTGFTRKIYKAEIVMYDEETKISMPITPIAENQYSLELKKDKETIITSQVNIQDNNKNSKAIEIKIEIDDLGELKFDIKYSREYNVEIDKVDTKNSIELSDITQADYQSIMKNLQNSKLYDVILSFASMNSSKDNNKYNTGLESGSNIIDIEPDNNNNNIIETEPNNNNNISSNSSALSNNQILSYDGKYVIKFSIPNGYKTETVSKNFLTLSKNYSFIDISTRYVGGKRYYENLKSTKEYFETQVSYSDVKLSEENTFTLNGRTFNSAILEYKYTVAGYSDIYTVKHIWTKVSDDCILEIEIDDINAVTETDLSQLLNITIEGV